MINTNELKGYMAKKGYTQESFCERIKMNPSTFYRKINGISVFTVKEVETIANELSIPKNSWQDIFFASSIA